MRLQELLRPTDILVGFAPHDKWEAIDRLVRHAAEAAGVPGPLAEELREAVLARERSMSTGMEHGIAIPHAAVDGIDRVIAALGIVPRDRGLKFDSVDAGPTFLAVLLLIPRKQKLLHIRTLADIARALMDESVRTRLFEAGSPEEAWSALGDR